MKVVLDTNILVSGLLQSKGNPAQVLELALAGALLVCYDASIVEEYREVLGRPRFEFDPERVREVLTKIQLDGLAVDASSAQGIGLPDPDDEPFLAVAVAAAADFLVTGNIAHYPKSKRRGCVVVTPAEFMDRWRAITP